MDVGVEERRLAIEIIATLVHIKRAMAELVLKPAGVPSGVYQPLLSRRDESTGRPLSKRQIAPLILDAVDKLPNRAGIIRSLIEIATNWSSFHLAGDEFAARATVEKARDLLGHIERSEAQEAERKERQRKEELGRQERERAELFRKESQLLLMMFEEMAASQDPQRRGYLLQELLNRTFDLHDIPLVRPFTRNEGAEQVDGAFKLEGWHYLVECRWRSKVANIRELDGLRGQIDRSGKQTMGLFLSINGWSEHVPALLKQNTNKSIILMEGYGLRTVLSGGVDLKAFLLAMLAKLNLAGEPFLPVSEYLAGQKSSSGRI